MVTKKMWYRDKYENKVMLEREDDGDFNIAIETTDGCHDSFLITKQDLRRMNKLNALYVESEQK